MSSLLSIKHCILLKEMAKNSDCLQTESLHPNETDSLLPFDQEATSSIPSRHCRPGSNSGDHMELLAGIGLCYKCEI